ncbi:sugar ABC transporter substrate-binding protein, partial [Mesorhizobium sp. M1C.F.Ca.ET.176.01.1.1]
ARRLQEDYLRQRERNENTRKIGLLTELRDTDVRLADTTARLQAASQKLQPAGASALPLPVSGEAIQVQITIVRKIGEEWRKQSVEEDSEVLPG